MKKLLLFSTVILLTTFGSSQKRTETKTTPSFFTLYEQNRQEQVPNYVTLDFILTATYLFKQQSITEMEEQEMFGLFKELALGLKTNLLKEYSPVKKEALAYVLVLCELLGITSQDVPKEVWALALKELTLITKHHGIGSSPIAKVKIDYTQYKVRAKYTKSSLLSSYFLALKYMSYMPFMVNAHPTTGVTEAIADQQIINAGFIADALKPLIFEYQYIKKQLEKLSGKGDDLSLVRLLDPPKFALVIQIPKIEEKRLYLNSLKSYPKINERIIDSTQIKAVDILKATLALKLLPSRFSPDGYIFSKLTYPNVGRIEGKKDKLTSFIDGKHVRGYPTVMDIAAVLVNTIPLESMYEGYASQVEFLKNEMNTSLGSIYTYDFAIYKQLLEDNRTTSFKGYYTQSKYIMNLYQKQSYTGGLKGMFFDNRTKAYLENDISKVLELVIQELKLFPKSKKFIDILIKLKRLDLQSNPYKKEDITFLNNIDMLFKNILLSTDTSIKVDIHTNPVEGKVMYESLEEPIVKVFEKGRGAVYNHREFIGDR